jgi:DNA modification methylase
MKTSTRKKKSAPASTLEPALPGEAVAPDLAGTPEQWSLDRISPYPGNALIHGQEQIDQLRRSMRTNGQTIPLIVNEDGVLIAGHGRFEALKQECKQSAWVFVARGWSVEQQDAYRISDNKIARNSQWDKKALMGEALRMHQLGVDLSQLGFSVSESAGITDVRPEGLTDADEHQPEPPNLSKAAAVTARGDVWQLGRHRITCGDSTNAADVDRVLAGAKPNLMVTDPPYGVDYDPAWREKSGLSSKDGAHGQVLNDGRADWRETWALFPGDVAYVWHGGLHSLVVADSLIAGGFEIRSQIIWAKGRYAISRGHYHWHHEPAFYAQRPGTDDHWQEYGPDPLASADAGVDRFVEEHDVAAYAVRKGASGDWTSDTDRRRKQSTLWSDIEHVKNETGHGTQKPVMCMRRPIENNSEPGAGVYEPFSGSGTTIIAAEITGRRCYAVELSPAYVDVAVKRWQAFTGLMAILVGDGRSFADVAAERLPAASDAAA